MRNVSDKSCTENQITHTSHTIIPPEYRALYEIMWNTSQMTQHGARALHAG